MREDRKSARASLRGEALVESANDSEGESPAWEREDCVCRWLAYQGPSIRIDELLFRPEHSLIDQSMSSRSSDTPTNGDGFGLGWYGARNQPGMFRSIRPAWNDFNLRELSGHIESNLFMAHVRATSLATVQETNCHPFRYGRWLFVHNGEIENVTRIRRDLLFAVAPHLFNHIQGTTDSELMFYLALTFGLEEDPIGGLERMVGFVEQTAAAQGIDPALWMTVGLTNGSAVFAARYASDGDAPSLYATTDAEHLFRLNQDLRNRFAGPMRLVVSEPIGNTAEEWTEIGQNMVATFSSPESEAVTRPFRPSLLAKVRQT
jgi:glutamine amidotransferase